MQVVPKLVTAFVLVGGMSGCLPSLVEQRSVSQARPDPDATPKTSHEARAVPPETVATLSGNSLDVRVQQRTECRDATTTPMVEDVTVSRSIPGIGTQNAQVMNASAALLLGLTGSYFAIVSPQCNDSTGASAPCSSSVTDTWHGTGYALIGLAAIPAAFLIANAIRAHDTTTTERAQPSVGGDWKTCGTEPLGDEPVTATVGTATLRGTTDRQGRVSLDLASVQPTPDLLGNHFAIIHHAGSPDLKLDIAGSPLYASAQAAVEAERARTTAAAQTEAERNQREQQRLKQECAQGKGDSCYRLAKTLPLGDDDRLATLKSACDLGVSDACVGYDVESKAAQRALPEAPSTSDDTDSEAGRSYCNACPTGQKGRCLQCLVRCFNDESARRRLCPDVYGPNRRPGATCPFISRWRTCNTDCAQQNMCRLQ